MTELEEAAIVLGGGATHTSTMSKRASVGTRKGQAVRPISTVLWWLYMTRTSRQIRLRSMSLSSGKDSTAMSMARWVDQSISNSSEGLA